MMKQTKWIALAVIFAMLLGGCMAPGKEELGGQITPLPSESQQEENPLALGSIQGGTYTNPYTGFGASFDENWTIQSAQELQQIDDFTDELLSGTEIGELTSKYPNFTDMMAVHNLTGNTVNVLYQRLGASEKLYAASMTEEEIIDTTMGQKDVLINSYTQMGYQNVEIGKTSVTFLGQTHTAMRTTCTVGGISCFIVQLVDYSRGEYGVFLTVTTIGEDASQQILDMFYAVD